MKSKFFLLFVATASLAFATTKQEISAKTNQKPNRKLLVTGGSIKVPGTQKGNVALFNCQNRAKELWLVNNAKEMEHILRCEFKVVKSDKIAGGLEGLIAHKEKLNANLAMFLVNEEKCPAGLSVYPEQGIVVVNVAPIAKGVDEKFFEMRCKKEIARGISYLCGGGSSQYPQSILSAITKPEDLDLSFTDQIPFDAIQKFPQYMKAFGITPYQKVTYKKAVQEGWAPAPTNDIQKAIWDKVHAAPKNPMKIEFDPKKGR